MYNQKENEWDVRKRLRLEQVREQSKEFAHQLRNKVFKEQKLKLKEIEHTKQVEHTNWKRKTLNVINQEYIECLRNIGEAHTNALLGKNTVIEEKKVKPVLVDNVCFSQTSSNKTEKLLPAVIESVTVPKSTNSKVNFERRKIKPGGSIKSKPKQIEHKDTQTEQYVTSNELIKMIESDNVEPLETNISQNAVEEEVNSVPGLSNKPHFSQISSLLKEPTLLNSSFQDNENDTVVPGLDSKPHFSQISNLLKRCATAQNIVQENNENKADDPVLDNKPHFSQISNLLKQRKTGKATWYLDVPLQETGETDDVKRRPSVVSFKSMKDPHVASGVSRLSTVYDKYQTSNNAANSVPRQQILDSKVQMYDNRTKFAKEYIPQQSLTQRTSTNPDSPNAMDLAAEENARMRAYLNTVDDRLKKDLERGENAIEREKLMRKYKILLTELEKLSTEEKNLKSFIHSHQPPQHEPKMQNMREFIEKRTIITSSEVRKQNSNCINVASIRSTSSSRSEDSRKSIVLDYEESLLLGNLSETNVNVDTINPSNKVSPILSGKTAKTNETQTSGRQDVVQTVKVPTVDSNGKKLFDAPIKITIEIQPTDRKETPKETNTSVTTKETNLRLSQLESNSSSLTEYRSLPKTITGSSRPPTGPILTDITKSYDNNENSLETNKKTVKEAELECYIRRLLQMTKESVEELPSVTDVPSIRESIIDTSSNAPEFKHTDGANMKTREKSIQFENRDWRNEDETDFSCISKYSPSTSVTSSVSTRKPSNTSLRKAKSYSILSNSSENGIDVSKQFDALTQNCNKRIIELTDLMAKARIERQQILERTSLSSGTGNVPNNSTEYHEFPSRLLLVEQKLPSQIEKLGEPKQYHELSTIMETGITESKLEMSPVINVDKIIDEVFAQSGDSKIQVVPYQFEEKVEDSEESLLDVYTEMKRRNILPNALKKLGPLSKYRNQSPKPLDCPKDETCLSSQATESLSISSSTNFNRRSLMAHSISSNGETSSVSSSLLKPALNLKEFLERELTKKNSSSDSGNSSKQYDEKGHRTSTPVIKQSSSKSLYLSIDAQSNLFSGESQISSVKTNTTSTTWDSA